MCEATPRRRGGWGVWFPALNKGCFPELPGPWAAAGWMFSVTVTALEGGREARAGLQRLLPSLQPRACSQRREKAERPLCPRQGRVRSSGKRQHLPGASPDRSSGQTANRARKDSEVAAYWINHEKQSSQSAGRATSWENKPQPYCTGGSNSTAGAPKKSLGLLGCPAGAERSLFPPAGMLIRG